MLQSTQAQDLTPQEQAYIQCIKDLRNVQATIQRDSNTLVFYKIQGAQLMQDDPDAGITQSLLEQWGKASQDCQKNLECIQKIYIKAQNSKTNFDKDDFMQELQNLKEFVQSYQFLKAKGQRLVGKV
jgi:hypothetical protein